MVESVVVFLLVYLLLASKKVDRTIVAILGASFVFFRGLIDFSSASASVVDFNVILLVVGMMTCVSIIAETGFFEWVTVAVSKSARGNPFVIVGAMLLLTLLFSAAFGNLAAVIFLLPALILVTQLLELPTKRVLIFVVMAANIGGMASLAGSPSNMIIGSKAPLAFPSFLAQVAPLSAILGALLVACALLFLRKSLIISEDTKEKIMISYPSMAIIDSRKLAKSAVVFVLMLAGFFLHEKIGAPIGVIALTGAALMLLLCRNNGRGVLKSVELDVIFFLVGIFIVTGAMEKQGVFDFLAASLTQFSGHPFLFAASVLVIVAVLSAFVDNIPLVIFLSFLAGRIFSGSEAAPASSAPFYWALVMGASLGCNGSLLGAYSNNIVAKFAGENDYKISFKEFSVWGMPVMAASLFIASGYLWLKFIHQ